MLALDSLAEAANSNERTAEGGPKDPSSTHLIIAKIYELSRQTSGGQGKISVEF